MADTRNGNVQDGMAMLVRLSSPDNIKSGLDLIQAAWDAKPGGLPAGADDYHRLSSVLLALANMVGLFLADLMQFLDIMALVMGLMFPDGTEFTDAELAYFVGLFADEDGNLREDADRQLFDLMSAMVYMRLSAETMEDDNEER